MVRVIAIIAASYLAAFCTLAVAEEGGEGAPDVGSLASEAQPEPSSSQSALSESSAAEVIEPLEPWVPRIRSSSSSISKVGTSSSISSEEEVSPDLEGFYYPPSNEPPPVIGGEYHPPPADEPGRPRPREKRTKLAKSEEQRLLAVKRKQYRRGRKFQREMRAAEFTDPRGEAELRICSVNLNGYGIKAEVKKILKVTAKEWLARERGVVAAIKEERCDVVAIQGILGRRRAIAQEGLDRLVQKLSGIEAESWVGFLGETKHSLAYNGFVYRAGAFEVVSKRHHAELFLPRFDEFVTKQFVRGPVEVTVKVPGKGEAESKVITLTTMDFRDSVKSGVKEGERPRMQMAEALRQLHELNEQRVTEFSQPTFVIMGDRGANAIAPSTRILEGAYRLSEFKKDGRCHLTPEEKLECSDPSHAPLKLIPLLGTNINRVKVVAKKQKEGGVVYRYARPVKEALRLERKSRLGRTAEIYVSPFDLTLFREDFEREGALSVGSRAVPNGLPHSPLVWAELNW